MADKVAIIVADDYESATIGAAIARVLDELGLALPRSRVVLLKPNILSQNYPHQCATTHPAVVEAVCALLADAGNRIVIGESSAFYQGGHTERGFRTSGIATVAKRFNAKLVAFEAEPLKVLRSPEQKVLKELLISAVIDEVDWIINLPKLKTHAFFQMSGAVKNLFGLVPGGAKYEYHFIGGGGRSRFAEKLADIWSAIRPQLSIMDAIWGLEGFGPSATGKPRHGGLLFAGENPWAIDWIAATSIGFDPRKLDGCQEGLARGYLRDPDRIDLVGDFPAIPVSPWKQAPLSEEKDKDENTFYRLVAVHPKVIPRRCTGCGDCVPACPLGAITIEASSDAARYPRIDLDRCLRCHHCVHVCPEKAIVLQGESPLNLPIRGLRKLFKI